MSNGSFAAAQERIAARQAARRAEAQASRAAQEAALLHTPGTRLPFPLDRGARSLASLWSTLLESEGTQPAFRVGQVDAELLDEELLSLLQAQVGEGLKYFGSHLQDDWTQEISLLLRAVLFKLSVWDNDASYGASLQNLRFTDARKRTADLPRPTKVQKILYGLINVFGRYGWGKLEDWLIEREGGYTAPSVQVQLLSRITHQLSTLHSLAAFASFVTFLVNGRYRTLTDRILRLRLIPPQNHISREVSFEYLNRQLVWHAFTEFLLFLLPLVGISRWRRWLGRVWKKTKAALKATGEDEDGNTTKHGPLSFLPERTCAICYQSQNPNSTTEADILGANTSAGGGVVGSSATDIVNPYETIPCGCIYCFVCIATKIEAEEGVGWSCLRCGETVYRCKPWSGDVFVEKRSAGRGKVVGFADPQKEQIHSALNDGLPSDLGSSQWTTVEAENISNAESGAD